MNADALAGQLTRAGFADDDAAGRARLVETAVMHHRRTAAARPERGWFVPGRLEVFGKHTDYCGGRSLVAAVPRGFAVVASRRSDGRVAVRDARWQTDMSVDPSTEAPPFRGWANYVAVVARRLARNFPGADFGIDLTIASDLPTASGLSSSSALVVGVATALADRARLAARDEWRAAIGSTFDLAGYLGAIENGFTFGALAGVAGVGTFGGSEDHTAILTGRPGTLTAFAYVPVRELDRVVLPHDWCVAVMTSGVHADKAGAVRDRYNRAALLARALVDAWRRGGGEASPATLADIVRSAPAAVDDLTRLAASGRGDFAGDALVRRLRHFLAEDARVLPAVDACRRGDASAIGSLADASQRDASELLGNQVPETDRLAALAREAGAFAACSFGAGFGGSVWAIVPAASATEVVDAWRAAYRREFPGARNVDAFTCRPSPGVTALAFSE